MAFSTRRMASKAILPEETPYLRAAQQWDYRIGDARAQARNWRLMAFSSIAIAGIFAAGFAYEATRVKVAAYYVPVDEIGSLVMSSSSGTSTRRPTQRSSTSCPSGRGRCSQSLPILSSRAKTFSRISVSFEGTPQRV
jgi:type IV secretory pathway TrbF-like protein